MKYLYIAGTALFTVYGQLILKWRINHYGVLPDEIVEKVIFLLKLLLDPYIISGFVAALVASFFWMGAMTKFDLSIAYPILTAGMVLLTVIFTTVLLGETVTLTKVLAVILIVSGVLLLTQTAREI